jgi:hypothetical protein
VRSKSILKKLIAILLIAGTAGAVTLFPACKKPAAPTEFAYILPESARLDDSPAEVRLEVAKVRHGDRVGIVSRTAHWARVETADGLTGWVELENLIDAAVYEKGRALLAGMKKELPQASGRVPSAANLRVEPARDAVQITQLAAGDRVEVFGRRMVAKSLQPGKSEGGDVPREAWYLVRSGERAGWVLGRLISLEIPEEISHYAQSFNLVAWIVLSTVDDNGRVVPQYVAADREDTQDYDFTRIRVFTWGSERHEYATAYVESHLKGFFPIRVMPVEGSPGFRLRLEDQQGQKIQKVYRMQQTIVRPIGIAEGWDSDAVPAQAPVRRGHWR